MAINVDLFTIIFLIWIRIEFGYEAKLELNHMSAYDLNHKERLKKKQPLKHNI
jgi:hypothetical protein